MQKHSVKNITTIIVFFLVTALPAFSFTPQDLLAEGDSLFLNKRYTQSLKIYDSLFNQGLYTSQMLLKMAYVHEALDNKPQTLFYLYSYFSATGNTSALKKMETLAENWGLQGYEATTMDQLSVILIRYRNPLLIFTSIIAVTGIFFITFLKKVKNLSVRGPAIVYLIIIVPLSISTNYPAVSTDGIVFNQNIPVMEGPSPASKVITRLPEGEKVRITDLDDIWTTINYDGKPAYVRTIYLKHF